MTRTWIAIACLFAVACASDPGPPSDGAGSSTPVYIPTWIDTGGPAPGAENEGRLSRNGGCLLLEGRGVSHVAIWPMGYTALQGENGVVAVVSAAGFVVAVEGQQIAVGGGQINLDETADRLAGGRIRAECRGGEYWMVTEILR